MSHEFDSGAFFRKQAWHGLGTIINERVSVREFMEQAGMNWNVIEEDIYNPDGTVIEGWKQLRRSDTNGLLHVCRKSWTVVQNQDAFQWFEPIVQDGDVQLISAVSLKGGRQIAISAQFTDDVSIEVVPDDFVSMKLVLYNSHDGTLAVGIRFTPVRVVCANTLSMVVNRKGFRGEIDIDTQQARVKHTKNVATNTLKVRECIDMAKRQFRVELLDEFRAMARKSLTTELWKTYLEQLFSKDPEELRAYDALTRYLESGLGADIPGVRGTMWGAYNAVTEWLGLRSIDSRLFGSGATLIRRAHELALKL